MRACRPCLLWTSVLIITTVLLTGCLYNDDAAVQQLSPAEQAEFAIYRHVMTGTQKHTYLAKASAAERTAYLSEIGLAQRYQRLDPADRETEQSGAARVGMSADALRLGWGDPEEAAGSGRLDSRGPHL